MTLIELQEKVLNLRGELQNLIANGEAEQRELNETENTRMAEIVNEIKDAEAEIATVEEENRKLNENNKNQTIKKKMKEVRLFDLIKGVVNGNLTEEQRQYVDGNKINFRAPATASTDDTIVASVATQGQENVPEDKKSLDVAIRNASVLNKIGATWFGNAVGDISIPRYDGSSVSWKGECEDAGNGMGKFSEVILTPHRLTAFIDISKQFLAQDSNDAEAILINDLASAIAEKLDMTIFGSESGDTYTPAGILQGDYVTDGGALTGVTYNTVLDLESAVEEKNGFDFMFVCNPKVKYALKGTQMASGLQMVWDGNEIDGYKAVVSNSVANKGILCLNPKDLAVATWSGVEILVDNYTQALKNNVRIVVNYLVDAKLRGNRIAGAIFDQQ